MRGTRIRATASRANAVFQQGNKLSVFVDHAVRRSAWKQFNLKQLSRGRFAAAAMNLWPEQHSET
jgi:hypothetical protein